jgi:hypothetical protein
VAARNATTKRVTRAFVDEIEDGMASLVVGKQSMPVPLALLPKGIREGAWIEFAVVEIAASNAQSSAGTPREELTRDDDGGGIKL